VRIASQLVPDEKIPKFVKIGQKLDRKYLTEKQIISGIRDGIRSQALLEKVCPGMVVCITAGSRGISNIALITKTLVEAVREKGAEPVIIPAMGSHGGATAEGQEAVLESYGITKESMGCRIHASMETKQIGVAEGIPVYIDSFAASCDGIIAVNRIKAHTAFRGEFESGLMKMLAVGLGKQKGAAACHASGFAYMAARISLLGKEIIRNAPILMGIAVIENAYDQTYKIEVLRPEDIVIREPGLLEEAKSVMGRIYFEKCDILIVRQIGKNFSGDGMDPNVTGRFSTEFASGGLNAGRVGILDLAAASQGSAVGMGKADIASRRLFEKIDFDATYANFVTTCNPYDYKMPIILDSDRKVIQALISSCYGVDKDALKMIIINNSQDLGVILVSQALLAECHHRDKIEVLSEPFDLEFDEQQSLLTVF